MRFLSAQRPSLTATVTLSRLAGITLQPQLNHAVVQGQRYASVKAQGAYKQKPKRGIPKKLGAKRTGETDSPSSDQFVIPGNIIYKQRGTLWWPGENCNMGRDHTIHATATGYVKYYRDPARHPDRKYIGVVFDKKDTLPYPAHAERKRRLNMTAHPIREAPVKPELSASGIPFEVRRVQAGEPDRLLKLRDDYSYREDNWRIGRLVKTTGLKLKRFRTRKQYLRNRRWRRERELAGQRQAQTRRAEQGGDAYKPGKKVLDYCPAVPACGSRLLWLVLHVAQHLPTKVELANPAPRHHRHVLSSASSKLMSLNSAIMAAQREWEQKKEVRGLASSSSTDSEFSDSTASDDKSSPESTKDAELALTDSFARPIAGEKRSPSNAALDASSRPTKRTLSTSIEESPGPSSNIKLIDTALKLLQDKREAEVRAHLRDVQSRGAWLTFNLNDAIAARADGMLYDYYYAPKGRVQSMSGALIPTNYRLDLSSQFPYVCPDIACGKSFDSARALGGHFSAAHKGSAYNDNCDGTFTKTGNFKRVPGESWRAIVVSRVCATGKVEEGAYADKNSEPFTSEHVDLTRPDPFTYVGQFTTRGNGYFEFLSSALVRELAQLPKRRQLPQSWIDFYKKRPVSLTIFGFALAYVTGVEVFGTDACNASLGETDYRLSDCSVAVPFELSSRLRDLHFPEHSCVGCYYAAEVHERANNCSWATRPRAFLDRYARRVDGLEASEDSEDTEDDDDPFAQPLLADETAQKRRNARAVEAAIKAGEADILELPPPDATSRTRQDTSADSTTAYNKGRANAAAVRQSLEQPSNRFVYSQSRALTEPKTVQGGPRPAGSYQPPPPVRMSRSAASLKNSRESFSPGSPTRPAHSAQTPPAQLEMESWEVAPGRMVDANGENIAYSNAYLNGREPVTVSEDVAFNVITIKPGDKARWEAHDSQLRTCSVASGKIEMRIGAKKFGTGPNSLFIIRPGEACVATNKLYIDATVHCTTVNSYSLLS
ncbi:hypothetical protein MY3296_008163 [Beauveria thailandica]